MLRRVGSLARKRNRGAVRLVASRGSKVPRNLSLVACNDSRAYLIRDHLLPIIRARGALENSHGPVRAVVPRHESWVFIHWTPFNELLPEEASSPRYRHALERQRRPKSCLWPRGDLAWRPGAQLIMVGYRSPRHQQIPPWRLGVRSARTGIVTG